MRPREDEDQLRILLADPTKDKMYNFYKFMHNTLKIRAFIINV